MEVFWFREARAKLFVTHFIIYHLCTSTCSDICTYTACLLNGKFVISSVMNPFLDFYEVLLMLGGFQHFLGAGMGN